MDIPTREELVRHYEDFCRRHHMRPTRFGRDATGEPQLIQSIRDGRSPSLDLLNRVASFMAERDATLDKPLDAARSADNAAEIIGEAPHDAPEADSHRPFAPPSSSTSSPTTAPSPPPAASPASSTPGAEAA
ncbi:MAG TPA: hypothetical protein VGF77_08315 [Allosphingosinicella sp.]|jgi:hypothetical protein